MDQRPTSPALARHRAERARSVQKRIADAITRFSGSMPFVYLHAAWFALWIALGVEAFPYGLLTMLVSLEAIFLSTFVLISQNRADERRAALADEEWMVVKEERSQNEELLRLGREILDEVRRGHTERARSGGPSG